ncbi:MAG: putative bifunctional diguanylate cyclase/phosphodiesterase [Gammaproteobacteria bacterium]
MTTDKRQLAFLHIEDDRIEAELVADLLRQTGFSTVRLVQRTRVALGLEALQNERFDLVLLDLNLPDGNGIDNLHRVRAVDERVPVVIMTNIEDENTALELVAKGAQDYLVKRELSPALLSRTLRYAMARQAADLRLRESERRFALAVAGARDGIWDWDLEQGRTWYSPRWFEMLALDAESALPIPETWLDRVLDEDRAGLKKALEAHLDGLTPQFEYEFRMVDGYDKPQWVLARGVAIRGADGHATRIAGSLTDITDRKTTEAMLVHEALHDALTGLPNRNLFLDRLDLALRQFKRDRNRKFAVLFLDLDRFKSINDSLGHAAGDALLIEIGRRLGKFVRPADSVARLGGDEFAILLGDVAGLAEATLVAERLHDLMGQKFIIAGKELHTTASIGIALADGKYERSADMLRDADLAMYRTKRRRGGSYAVFDNVMHETALARLELETDLRAAAQRNELAVYYQPIVSLDHMRVIGFEALVRWFHPVRGLLAPDDFIPLAEESGSIGQLTWWVMHEACRQTRSWQLSDPTLVDLSISVNVSSRLFSEPDFAARTQAILEDTGLAPAALHLEITENALLEHEAETVRELSALQQLGVKLHLDDFGTGYSSLSYLNLFAYDTLKIDRTFVAGSTDGGRDNRIVDALINLGRVLEMNVIAEGVETQEQAQKLRDLNCGMAQGFWFSKPLPSDSAHALLLRELDVARSSIRNLTRH